MKHPILLLALFSVLAFASCTTAYKTGQTPDDVYYSPATPEDEYVSTERRDNKQYQGSDEYYDDRYLRMKVRNRYRWNDLDEWYYYGNRYSYSYYNFNYWNNPWTPYMYWNYAYNPYSGNYGCNPYYSGGGWGKPIGTPTGRPKYASSGPRTFNLNTYNSSSLTNNSYNTGSKFGSRSSNNNVSQRYNNTSTNSNRNNNAGSVLRNIFGGNNNNNSSNNSNNSNNSRSSSSSTPSSSSSSSSGGSSGGSAPARRF
jgi:hypothetical protein